MKNDEAYGLPLRHAPSSRAQRGDPAIDHTGLLRLAGGLPRNDGMCINRQNSGFTLIELSVALVIIGLLVGGVLVGRDLIQAAKNHAAMSELNQVQLAVNTFKLKYNGIPGDLDNASELGLGASGNGNKVLDGVQPTAYVTAIPPDGTGRPRALTNGESGKFWAHLSAAGLTGGSYTAYVSGGADPPSDHFPKFKNGSSNQHYIYPFTWGNRTFVTTGAHWIATNHYTRFAYGSIKGGSVRNITQKLGYEYIEHTACVNNYTNCGWPNTLAAGHRVIPSAINNGKGTGDDGIYMASRGIGASNRCTTGDEYNEDGDCHLIWQID